MASANGHAPGSTKGKEFPFSTSVEAFLMKNNQSYAPKPDLDAEKAKIQKSHVLIPYSIFGTVYAFLGPYQDPKLKPQEVKEVFSDYGVRKPIIFSEDIPNISFITYWVFQSSSSNIHSSSFLRWLKKVKLKKVQACKTLGIFNLIQLSKTGLGYDENLILATMHF